MQVTTEDLAGLFQVTTEAVRKWIKSGMPVANKGSRGGGKDRDKTLINLRDAVEWYFAENYERLELDRQRTRHSSEQADKLALENAERRGDLGELELWQRELERFLGELRSALLALPTKLAPRLDGDVNQRKDRLEQAIHEALRAVAAYQSGSATAQHPAADTGLGDNPAAALEVNGQPVGGPETPALKRKQRRARPVGN